MKLLEDNDHLCEVKPRYAESSPRIIAMTAALSAVSAVLLRVLFVIWNTSCGAITDIALAFVGTSVLTIPFVAKRNEMMARYMVMGTGAAVGIGAAYSAYPNDK
jgi:hypothetical protein